MDQQSLAAVPAIQGMETGRQRPGMQAEMTPSARRVPQPQPALRISRVGAGAGAADTGPERGQQRESVPGPAGASPARSRRPPVSFKQHTGFYLPNISVMLHTACPEKSPKSRNQVQHRTQPPNNSVMSYLSISKHSTSANFSVNSMFCIT